MTKSTKRKIVTLAAVICVFALAAAGTLAYFADKTDVATNTFTIGKVQIRLSEGIVDELGHTKDTNTIEWTQNEDTKVWTRGETYTAYTKAETGDDALVWALDGSALTSATTRTKDGNKEAFKITDSEKYGYSLVPGRIVDKDPVVTVLKNSEPSYVRVKVTLNKVQEFMTVYKNQFGGSDPLATAIAAVKDSFVGYNADTSPWKLDAESTSINTQANTITVVFNYDGIVAQNTKGNTNLEPIINGVMLPTWVDNDDVKEFMTKTEGTDGTVTYSGTPNFSVEVVAEAIQAEGFADAKAAWTAFDKQMNPTTAP